jgi:hypothetical protein
MFTAFIMIHFFWHNDIITCVSCSIPAPIVANAPGLTLKQKRHRLITQPCAFKYNIAAAQETARHSLSPLQPFPLQVL